MYRIEALAKEIGFLNKNEKSANRILEEKDVDIYKAIRLSNCLILTEDFVTLFGLSYDYQNKIGKKNGGY